jgi:hypothetical protein
MITERGCAHQGHIISIKLHISSHAEPNAFCAAPMLLRGKKNDAIPVLKTAILTCKIQNLIHA